MDIDLTGFSAPQQRALFDLLILAMYADGHLTTVEDEQLQKLLTAFGYTDEFDRQREFDAAVTRMRPFVQSIQQAKEQALLLADTFTSRSQQKQVYAAVQQIMTSDTHVSSWENTLLSELGLQLRMGTSPSTSGCAERNPKRCYSRSSQWDDGLSIDAMKTQFRNESDSMGEVFVPADAYYGAQTARAVVNFPISGLRFSRAFIRALGLIKKHAAATNAELGLLDQRLASAIQQAAQEVADGKLDAQFVVD